MLCRRDFGWNLFRHDLRRQGYLIMRRGDVNDLIARLIICGAHVIPKGVSE